MVRYMIMKKAMKQVRRTAATVKPSQCFRKKVRLSVLTTRTSAKPSMINLSKIIEVATRASRMRNQRSPVIKAFDAGMFSSDRVPANPEKFPGNGSPGLTGPPYHEKPDELLTRSLRARVCSISRVDLVPLKCWKVGAVGSGVFLL